MFVLVLVFYFGNFDDYVLYGLFFLGFIFGGEVFLEVKFVLGFLFRLLMVIIVFLIVFGFFGFFGKNMLMFYCNKNEVGFEILWDEEFLDIFFKKYLVFINIYGYRKMCVL